MTALEERVNWLEQEKAARESELCKPEVCRTPEKIKLLNKELVAISQELKVLYDDWHGLARQLEELDSIAVGQ